MTLAQILDATIIMAGLVVYWFYVPIFFSKIRPALAERFGRNVGSSITEDIYAENAGTWEPEEGASPWTQAKVLVLDATVIVLGLVAPFGLVALLCAIIVESRVIADLANSFSGDTVKIEELRAPPVFVGTALEYAVKIHNLSSTKQKDCYLSMFDNRHQLYASSEMFDLDLDQTRELKFKGAGARTAGKYEVVMKLFCPPAIERDRSTHLLSVKER